MALNNLPPQAYTRDTLAVAYEWLKAQPQSVRELANNADALVALYMQSRRRAQEETVSSESFKSDLKALAENMKAFEDPKPVFRAPASDIRPQTSAPISAPAAPTVTTPSPGTGVAQHLTSLLDQKSTEIIQNTRQKLNLGSDMEAIRLLLVMGYERIKDILPKS